MPDKQVRQAGAALLAALLVLVLAAASLLTGYRQRAYARAQANLTTATALALARDALIGRAVTDDNRPGSLPCPAPDETGQSALFAGTQCPFTLGRFPWRTMRTGELRDGSGALLWYAVTAELRDHPNAEPINASTTVNLMIDGTRAAALVFAPGRPVGAQAGRPSNAARDYLDGGNADGDTYYIGGPALEDFNDSVLALTPERLFGPVGRRVLGEIGGLNETSGLRAYHRLAGELPWADTDGDGYANVGSGVGRLPHRELALPEWMLRNDWLADVSYRRLDASTAQLTLGKQHYEVRP